MKIKLKKALKLSTDSIAKLQESQMATVKGGTGDALESSSGPKCTCKNGDTCKTESPEVPEA
jgi:natural product precursor